jgi:regulatory protein
MRSSMLSEIGRMLQTITALRLQKRNRQRVNVYLDGQYAFALQAVLAAPLRVGQNLTSEEIDRLKSCDAAEIAYDRALHFLSYRPRSRAEIANYLRRRKAQPHTVDTVIGRLEHAGLVDDSAFAQYWVENRESFRPRGARALRHELFQKGVSASVIAQAVEEIDETGGAYRAAQRRARRLRHLDYQVFRRRLGGFLQRRGFGYDVVRETVDRLWRELQDSSEAEMS